MYFVAGRFDASFHSDAGFGLQVSVASLLRCWGVGTRGDGTTGFL